MKSTEILDLFARFEAAASKYEGIECWSARELQTLLGYSKWENFAKVISKAKESCLNAGEKEADHFPDVFLDNYNSPIYENSINIRFPKSISTMENSVSPFRHNGSGAITTYV